MDLFFVILFLVIYYIRPQDWMGGLVGVNLVKPVIALGLLGFLSRKRGVQIGDIFKTPHDWVMLFYAAYIIFTAPGLMTAFTGMMPLVVFYFLTVQALNSEEKILRYMKWWTAMLLALAALAVVSLYGLDVTGGMDFTERFQGRLSLGTWTHDNPNALGHSVVVALPMTYFLLFWKSPWKKRILAIPLMALAFYCVWKTQSKGAFLVGAGAVVLTTIFGRGKFIQILILITAFILGGAALAMLPRMSQMNSLRSDEGVQGRILAWEMARTVSKSHDKGVGWKQFQAYVEYEGGLYLKATHSTYVKIAADLGYPGLCLFLAILWCDFRVLISLRTDNQDLERSRRILFLILATYAVSGWMIDRSYHTEFFLLAACCAAIHRTQLQQTLSIASVDNGSLPAPEPRVSLLVGFNSNFQPKPVEAPRTALMNTKIWRRLGILDTTAAISLTWATLYTWDYILKNI